MRGKKRKYWGEVYWLTLGFQENKKHGFPNKGSRSIEEPPPKCAE